MEEKLFTSVEEECLHWKERCLKVSQERDDAQREFDDFTAESRQLEAELEMTVEQQEKKIRDLNALVNQLHSENESYKRKMQYTENETNKIDADYRLLAKENEKLKVYIRELEQKNDDLERANRVASESVAEFESMLNQAYEKNALLELEVDEKERMQIKLQRLMDEARDLKQELKVRTLKPDEKETEDGEGELLVGGIASGAALDSNKLQDGSVAPATTTVIATAIGANNLPPDGGAAAATAMASPEDTKLETLNNNLNTSKLRQSPFGSPMVKLSAGKLKNDLLATDQQQDDGKSPDGKTPDGKTSSPARQLIIERNGNGTASALALVPSAAGGSLNAPMAPSDRVSTLNIVADLLRRLDNMEAKLKAWKIRKPSSRAGGPAGSTTAGSLGGVSRTSLHTSHTMSNLHHHSSGGGGGGSSNHLHQQQQQHPPHHHSNNHYQSQHADSNLSLNSLGSGDGGSLLQLTGGNVQLHSYQPSTITIGTQTSQHLGVTKAELLRTNK